MSVIITFEFKNTTIYVTIFEKLSDFIVYRREVQATRHHTIEELINIAPIIPNVFIETAWDIKDIQNSDVYRMKMECLGAMVRVATLQQFSARTELARGNSRHAN